MNKRKFPNYVIGVDMLNNVCEGYDMKLIMPSDDWTTYEECPSKLTKQDCLELADVMIKRWQDFKKHWSNYDDAGN